MPSTRKLRTKTYEIHDNGGRPFFVEIEGTRVSVKDSDHRLFSLKAKEIFLGKKSPTGVGYSPSGNTILLKLSSKNYRYIGSEIYDFSPVKGDTILKYYSDIGNSDVPYPYAVGKTHVYIMLDKVAVEKSYFDMKQDIYGQYYYEHKIHMCLKGNPKTDICKENDIYGPRLKEFEAKKVDFLNLRRPFATKGS